MIGPPERRNHSSVSRRTAVAGFGAAGLGLAAARDIVAQEATPTFGRETDVVYGEAGGQPLLLDIYRPPDGGSLRPAMILIHGGGWTEGFGDRSDMVQPAIELAGAGYVVFNIAYRLLGGAAEPQAWPAQLDDVQRAVRWVRANAGTYGVQPDRIGAYGASAGGHLAACLGVRETRDNSDPALAAYSSRVACVVDLAGDTDLAIPYPQAGDRQIVIDLLGGTADEAPEVYRDASPLFWVDESAAPFLILHGASDRINPVAHSRNMARALHEAGVEVIHGDFPGLDHMDVFPWSFNGPWTLLFLQIHLDS